MNLAMTLMVRDEADIIEDNLRYHRAQGIDFFVVADTGSTDGTLEILERYESSGRLRLERSPTKWGSPAEEGVIQTMLSRVAWEMDADWVVHNDADEFWWPVTGSLKDVFSDVPDDFGMLMAPRTEFVVRPDGPGSFAERLTVREAHFRRPPRTAHRAHPRVRMWRTHPNDVWVDQGKNPRWGLVGRPALRTEAAHAEEQELELVLTPRFPVGILHFPIRSLEQYRKKIALVAEAGRFKKRKESREVRAAFEADELDRIYRKLALDDDELARGIAEGWLVEDTDFRDYLLACPGFLEDGDPPPGARAWPEQRRQAALAELAADAGYALSRYLQTAAFKTQTGQKRGGKRKATGGRAGADVTASSRTGGHKLVFVGGLHRSGTTLLARALREHPDASGFRGTNVNANEGQHLQTVYPILSEFGGAGRFGFDDRSHLTEASPLVSDASRDRLFAEWGRHWDLSKPVLIEKSPGNLLKLRFLQALFEDAVFIVVMRHPIAVSYATQKWTETSMEELLDHWLACHERFLEDAPHVPRLLLVRYEDFVTGPRPVVENIEGYLGLTPVDIAVSAREHRMNDPYFQRWNDDFAPGRARDEVARRFEERINRFGYSIEDPDRAVDPAPEVATLLDRPSRALPSRL